MDRTRLPTGLRGSKSIHACLPNSDGVRMDRTRLPMGLRGSKSIRACLPNGQQHPLAHVKERRSRAGPTLTCHRLAPRVPARTTILLAPAQWCARSDHGVHAQAHTAPAAGHDPALLLARGAHGLPHVLPRPLSRCSPRVVQCSPLLWCTDELHALPSTFAPVSLHPSKHNKVIVLKAHVTNVYFKVFQMFHLDVARVAMAIHVCYKYMFQMFSVVFRRMLQVYVPNV
jgi:hypothetical protein